MKEKHVKNKTRVATTLTPWVQINCLAVILLSNLYQDLPVCVTIMPVCDNTSQIKQGKKSNKQPNFMGTRILKCFTSRQQNNGWVNGTHRPYVCPFSFNIEYKKLHIIIPFACKKQEEEEEWEENTELLFGPRACFQTPNKCVPRDETPNTYYFYICFNICYTTMSMCMYWIWPAVSFDNRPIIVMHHIHCAMSHEARFGRRSGPSKIIRNALKWKMCHKRFRHSPG